MNVWRKSGWTAAALIGGAALLLVAQTRKGGSVEEAAMHYNPEEAEPATPVETAKHKHEAELMAIEGVEGVGIGLNPVGDPAITIYVRDPSVKRKLPAKIDGFAVQTEIVGLIDAQADLGAAGGRSPK